MCDRTGSESKGNESGLCNELYHENKRGFSVLLARYGYMNNVSENNFSANFKDM